MVNYFFRRQLKSPLHLENEREARFQGKSSHDHRKSFMTVLDIRKHFWSLSRFLCRYLVKVSFLSLDVRK